MTGLLGTDDGRPRAVMASAPPYEREGTTIITAASARAHTAARAGQEGDGGRELDAQMAGSRPMGAFVLRGGRVRWYPAVDATRVITTAELVLGAVLVAAGSRPGRRGPRRPW